MATVKPKKTPKKGVKKTGKYTLESKNKGRVSLKSPKGEDVVFHKYEVIITKKKELRLRKIK